MPFQQLFILAVAAMVFLAVMRVVRVQSGRAPHPEGMAKLPFGVAFVSLPPLALGLLTDHAGATGVVGGLAWVPVYAIMLVGLLVVMRVAAVIVAAVAPRSRLLLALIASEGDPYDVPPNPPVTPRLAAMAAVVRRSNDVFPTGLGFRAAIDRPGFRATWDALDAATGRLEAAMAEDQQLGRGVASAVTTMARDARSRLGTLRQLAVDDGQSWVAR